MLDTQGKKICQRRNLVSGRLYHNLMSSDADADTVLLYFYSTGMVNGELSRWRYEEVRNSGLIILFAAFRLI